MFFRFENIHFLWGLALVPVWWLFLWFYFRWKSEAISKFATAEIAEKIGISFSRPRFLLSAICSALSISLLTIAAANPQFGTKTEEVKRSGVDIMLALDISNSMRATDIQPNRITAAKRAINGLLNKLKEDRLGLIVFAGESFVQLPITSDFDAARLFIDAVNVDMIASQGTSAGSAIDLAVNSFDPKSVANKIIILISDGESHDDDPVSSARIAAEKQIRVHCIGIGSESGVPIPSPEDGGFKRDEEGNTVVTRLNADALFQIAQAGKGIFVKSGQTDTGLWKVWEAINSEEKKETGSVEVTDFESRFQLFLIPAIFLLMIDPFISERKSNSLRRLLLPSKKIHTVLFLPLLIFSTSQFALAQHPNKLIREGNKLYEEKKFLSAEKKYNLAKEKNPDDYVSSFNHAATEYQLKNFDKAREEWEKLMSKEKSDERKSELLHNLGNTYLEEKKYDEAIESYKKGLKLNPSDNQTRYNLAYAQSMLRQQKQQQQKSQQDKKNDKKNQDKKQDKNQNNENDSDKQNQDKNQNDPSDKNEKSKNDKDKQGESPKEISREDAERLLKSLGENEKNLHRKLDKRRAGKGSQSKDW
ncbi:MAG: hypothetical protein RLZZ46_1661 [Bacteroidota bacterium]